MGGLAHYLEDEGLPTTQISLIRSHTEAIRPPRAVWVPFILGRPLGRPGDPAFQTRVLRRALQLFEENSGPVLVDHDEETDEDVDMTGLSCPVSYAPPEGGGTLAERLADELSGLATWYELQKVETGRTAFGTAGLSIEEVATLLVAIAEAREHPPPPPRRHLGDHVRLAGEDLKAFVTEAATAQPGSMSAFALKAWFWEQTVAGETLLEAYRSGTNSSDRSLRALARVLVPAELRSAPAGSGSET